MIATKLIIDSDLQENIPYISRQYACYTCYEQFDFHPEGNVPWHWHPEVELTLILEGGVRVLTNNGEHILYPGDGMFLNSNVLHYKEPITEGKVCTVNHVFDPGIVGGQFHSVFEQQYVKPLVECNGLDSYIFRSVDNKNTEILNRIWHAYDITVRKETGFELLARNDFSVIWLALFEIAKEKIRGKKNASGLKEERVKVMMLFIHKNYAAKLTLEQIAEAANISKRECLRCFQEVLNMTPFTYLLEYRLRKAAELIRETNQSIAEIGYNCGFSSTSYFTKLFREKKQCTPSEYRKQTKNREWI